MPYETSKGHITFLLPEVSISKCNENVILKKEIFSKLSMYHIIIPFKLHISSITDTQSSFNLYCHIALQLLYVGNFKNTCSRF